MKKDRQSGRQKVEKAILKNGKGIRYKKKYKRDIRKKEHNNQRKNLKMFVSNERN
jgi:hypothetical protein